MEMKKYITIGTLNACIRGDTTFITWGFILNFKRQYIYQKVTVVLFELHLVL